MIEKGKTRPAASSSTERDPGVRDEAALGIGESGQHRRGFFGTLVGSFLAIGFVSLGLTHLLWLLGTVRFLFPNALAEPPKRFRVGPPDDYPPGTVETEYKEKYGVWIVHGQCEGRLQIYALKAVCTHLGCTPSWSEAEQRFTCPCHGSAFYRDGINIKGPAQRPLERYAIRIADDGRLEVDKGKTFRQELGQWNDPASFVMPV